MAFKTLQVRRDAAANWTSVNPTLHSGEPGFETDTGKHKYGDGSTLWNDLPYNASAFTDLTDAPSSYTGEASKIVSVTSDETGLEFTDGGGTGVQCGKATLSSGTVTVLADWITAQSRIVATPLTAPGTPGSTIYVDNIVNTTSFDILSEDSGDSRNVFWIAAEEATTALALPDLFYVQFKVTFDPAEMASENGGALFNCNGIGTPTDGFTLMAYSSSAPAATYNKLQPFFQWPGSSDSDIYDVTLIESVEYLFDLKFDFALDHLTFDLTTRLDTVVLGTINATPESAFSLSSILLGATSNGESKRTLDDVKIGTSGYGTSDLFSADFATDLAPFDSLENSGISVTGGVLTIDILSGNAYALKATN